MNTTEKLDRTRPDTLSFVTHAKVVGFNFWNVQASGDYTADCVTGRELGNEYLAFIGEHPTNGNLTLLGCIVGSMIHNAAPDPARPWRTTTGLEIGFMATVNGYAMATAKLVRMRDAA